MNSNEPGPPPAPPAPPPPTHPHPAITAPGVPWSASITTPPLGITTTSSGMWQWAGQQPPRTPPPYREPAGPMPPPTPPPANDLGARLTSRKLWITIVLILATLSTTLVGKIPGQTGVIVMAGIGAAYVIAQAIVDAFGPPS